MFTRNSVGSVLLLVSLFFLTLTACSPAAPQSVEATQEPVQSVIRLVENGDDTKNVYTSYNGNYQGYSDVSLETEMAAAQFICTEGKQYSFSVGVASIWNASELPLTDCPEVLADGVRVQLVSTSTKFGFDCRNCTMEFDGEYEYGVGVTAWRGIIKITKTGNEEPVLFLVPVTMP